MKAKHINIIKRITDVGLLVLLLCLMAYQVMGEKAHEWVGIAMTVLVVVHQLLNIKWYTKFFKGKYNLYRILLTLINALLFASFAMTAFCGMSMSAHAVPKLYGTVKVSFARKMHLALSHWTFVFMGLHLGMHIPIIMAKYKLSGKVKNIISALSCFVAGYGLYLFIRQNITDYMFFKVPFAFLDYEKAGSLVFFENILMLLFFVFIGAQLASLCRQLQKKDKEKKNPLVPLVFIMAAVILGLVINMILTKNDKKDTAKTGWGAADNTKQEEAPKKTGNLVLINGGTFRMGSPESENWRIEDETEHEVTVSSFYVDPYETTQEEYDLSGKRIIPFCLHGRCKIIGCYLAQKLKMC
ncbi:MAG: DUF4405 domain-containing protein [Lachnospiraceae bacterium]|nr:DUF4405 domain-containing protein [Lachnospiraceae bacterium]